MQKIESVFRQALSGEKASNAPAFASLLVPRRLQPTMLLELHDAAVRLADPADTNARPDPAVLMAAVDFAVQHQGRPLNPNWRAGMFETRTRLLRLAVESLRQAHAIAVLLDAQAARLAGTAPAEVTLPCDVEPQTASGEGGQS